MKIKVFYPNQQGKLEFTKKELEELLNEAYHEGYQDGDRKHWYNYPYYGSMTALNSSNTLDSVTSVNGYAFSYCDNFIIGKRCNR